MFIFATMTAFFFLVAPGKPDTAQPSYIRKSPYGDDDDDTASKGYTSQSYTLPEEVHSFTTNDNDQQHDTGHDGTNQYGSNMNNNDDAQGSYDAWANMDPDTPSHATDDASRTISSSDTTSANDYGVGDIMMSLGLMKGPKDTSTDGTDNDNTETDDALQYTDTSSQEKDDDDEFANDDWADVRADVTGTTGPQLQSVANDAKVGPGQTPEQSEAIKLLNTVSSAIRDIDEAKDEEISKNESMLTKSVNHFKTLVEFGLGAMFGNDDDVTTEEMEEIANEVASRLEEDVMADIKEKADTIAGQKVRQIEQVRDKDEQSHLSKTSIREDVLQMESPLVDGLKKEIDKTFVEVEGTLQSKTDAIEEEVVNKKLKAKGKRVAITNGKIVVDKSDASGRTR